MVRSRRTRKRLAPEQRRAEIVEAADRVFSRHDPAAVTFEEIAAEAGVSRALVYTYFGDKGGLIAAVYVHTLARLDTELRAALLSEDAPRERIRRVVDCYVTFARSDEGPWQFLSHVASTRHPAVQAARRVRFDALASAWGGGAHARVAVAGLMGLLEATVLDWLETPDLDEQRFTELVEQLVWSGVEGLFSAGPELLILSSPAAAPGC